MDTYFDCVWPWTSKTTFYSKFNCLRLSVPDLKMTAICSHCLMPWLRRDDHTQQNSLQVGLILPSSGMVDKLQSMRLSLARPACPRGENQSNVEGLVSAFMPSCSTCPSVWRQRTYRLLLPPWPEQWGCGAICPAFMRHLWQSTWEHLTAFLTMVW